MGMGGLWQGLGVGAQALVVLVSFATLALFPPREGAILLVPLDQDGRAKLVADAVSSGATLLAQGPLPASVVVEGNRHRLGRSLANGHVLMFAAPRSWCGPTA
jgi:hypothetical protein